MRHAHLAVVRGAHDQRVLEQPRLLQGVQHLDQRGVGRLDQIGVEVEVVALLLRVAQRAQTGVQPGGTAAGPPVWSRGPRRRCRAGDLTLEPGSGVVAAVLARCAGRRARRAGSPARRPGRRAAAARRDGAQILQHALLASRPRRRQLSMMRPSLSASPPPNWRCPGSRPRRAGSSGRSRRWRLGRLPASASSGSRSGLLRCHFPL